MFFSHDRVILLNISPFLDNCYACDPRLKKFREEEKERKVAERKAKEEAARLAAEEQEKVSLNVAWNKMALNWRFLFFFCVEQKKQEALEAERILREKEEQEAKEKVNVIRK